MGGRGAWSYTRARAPNYKKAVIRRSRVSDYLLNPSKSKGKNIWLNELGYNMKNQAKLQKDLLDGLKNNRARVSEPNKYGTVHIQVNMMLGINKRRMAMTGWFIRKGSNIMELSTIRPYKERNDKF